MTDLIVRASIRNPLDGILPDFGFLGMQFTELWQKLVAGIWALAIVVAIVFLILGIMNMAKNSSSNPQAYREGRTQALWAGISLGGLAALPVIVGGILLIFG